MLADYKDIGLFRGQPTIFREETYYQFIRRAKDTDRSNNHSHKASERTFDNKWAGSESLEQAFDFAFNGWDAGLKQIPLDEGVAVTGGIEFTEAVHGAVVNIGGYLQGLPDCMYDITEKREYNLEPLTIYVQLDYLADIRGQQAARYCMKILEYINKYQSKHNIKLIGVFETDWRGKYRQVNQVIIKDFDQRFVLNNLAFAFHPSFFRRILFKVLEIESWCDYGYGGRYTTKQITERLQATETFRDKTIIFPSLGECRGSFDEKDIVELK